MTTEEVIRKLFPKRVVERAKQVAAESDARTRPSIGGRRLPPSQGIDVTALVSRFHSEDQCRAYLEQSRWPGGVRCLRCDASKGISRIERRRQFDCSSCGYQFSVRAGTIFQDSHLPLWKWFLAVYAMGASNAGVPRTSSSGCSASPTRRRGTSATASARP